MSHRPIHHDARDDVDRPAQDQAKRIDLISSGRVQPAEPSGASVSSRPQATEGATDGSYGNTDASGKYVLKLVTNDQEGAVPGMHRVSISLTKASTDDSPTKKDLPAANFDLTSK